MTNLEDRSLILRCGEACSARLLGVVRNHHEIMPGPDRDRPGLDRLRVEVPGRGPCVVDVWSTGAQDVAAVTGVVELFEDDGVLRWRSTAAVTAPPANDQFGDARTAADAVGERERRAARSH